MIGKPRRRIRELPLHQMLPNVLTMLALCAGLTALRFGFQGQWELAVGAVFVAAVLDALDGRIARRLGATSKFGAELDSLSDFVCFGVTPALLIYIWSLNEFAGPGWVVALLFAICAALRLARFNARIGLPDLPSWTYNHFTGLAAPAGAASALLPMMLSFQFGDVPFAHPLLNAAVLLGVGALMISRTPTYSFKLLRVPARRVVPTLIGVAVLAALVVTAPWATLTALLALYLASIPLAVRSYRRLAAETQDAAPLDPEAAADAAEELAFEPIRANAAEAEAEPRDESAPRRLPSD